MPESANPEVSGAIRDRIVGLKRVRAQDLLPHPANWRRHPPAQQQALRAMLEEVGYAGALLVRETEGDKLQIIDGHLRAETTPDLEVPVLVLDVTEAEAEKLLLTLDPLAALATRDDSAMRALLERVETSSAEVRTFLDGLAAQLPPALGEKEPLTAVALPEGFADIRQGHVLEVLRGMPDASVHCIMTSPPYWGLRDFGLPPSTWSDGWTGGLGLEPTLDLYIQHMVEVFREVRRVLREDGTVWLNMGDAYAQAATRHREGVGDGGVRGPEWIDNQRSTAGDGLKPKDLLGMPWRVAFALQQDGWYLRSDIIWSKPNPMPESVIDRPIKAHEYLFLLARNEEYYYDAEAIREPHVDFERGNNPSELRGHSGVSGGLVSGTREAMKGVDSNGAQRVYNPVGRNRRTVWEIATQPYPDAHFATFPEALVEPCVLAGTSERGCCSECGAPWEREVERSGGSIGEAWSSNKDALRERYSVDNAKVHDGTYRRETLGWHPTCGHNADPVPCTVLDPFAGSGTALVVGKRLGRSVIGIELNPDYCALITRRLAELVPTS